MKQRPHPLTFATLLVACVAVMTAPASSAPAAKSVDAAQVERLIVTRGLLEKANDDQLRGVIAHALAHEDLGRTSSSARGIGGTSWPKP